MSEKGILFSAPMVRAILDGRKTQTRRVVKPQPCDRTTPSGRLEPGITMSDGYAYLLDHADDGYPDSQYRLAKSQPYRVGDLLWVKETWAEIEDGERGWNEDSPTGGWVYYRATDSGQVEPEGGWRPSIFMPRWASRITLKVEEVRVQRLQDINESDARAEGIDKYTFKDDRPYQESLVNTYERLWDSLNKKKHPWSSNPWIWAVTFCVAEGPKE